MVVMAETVAVAMIVVMAVVVLVVMRMVVIHASIPLAGSAMCSNMVESRLLMWASAAE
jgi:hypothetical protein